MNLALPISKLSFLASAFRARGLILTLALSLATQAWRPALAQGDWPQILGPQRDGQTRLQSPIATDWPGQLKIRWRAALGSGFGGSAIVAGRVLTLHRSGDKEILEATSLEDGSQQWQCAWPATYQGRINPDEGPRCVPVVMGERVFCYGAAGDLVCVGLTDGKLLWRRPLRSEYRADDGYFGAGSTPLAIDDLVIVCLGGEQAGIVAVEQSTGKTRWTATKYEASYASPIAIPGAAGSLALVVTRLNAVLVDVASGDVLSDVKFGSRGPTVNAATPIPLGNQRYFLTASYGVGGLTLEIDDSRRLVELSRNAALASQYNSPVLVGEYILGINGREDVGVASLRAIAVDDQRVVWEQDDFGTAHLIAAGSQVLALALDGRVSLIDGAADQFELLAEGKLPAATYRALPALSGKRLVVRGSSNQRSELVCVELP